MRCIVNMYTDCHLYTAAAIVNSNNESEKVPLWKLQPLMSAPGLWETDTVDSAFNPHRHIKTNRLINIMTRILKDMHRDAQHVGRKTLLLREAGFVKLVLKGGELICQVG